MEWSKPTIKLVLKYHENDGISTFGGYLGENFWNEGKTKEIKDRVLHI